MRNILTIFKRELRSSFDSPLAYIIVPVFLGLVGIFTIWFQGIFEVGLTTLRSFFSWSAMFFLLLIPAVTMRLFSEERRTGSLEMLVTLPISEYEIVLGKYLSALALLVISLVLTLTYPITMAAMGDLDVGPVLGGYAGLFLLGASFSAIGTAASALTKNQVVAFLLALVLCLLPFAVGFFLHQVPSVILPVVQYISFDYHFNNLARGVLDTRNIIYYASIIALSLHVAVFALRHRRLV